MRRFVTYGLILFMLLSAAAVGLYYFNQYWIHRYDDLIKTQAKVYKLDERLVWSVIYEETYFRAWQIGSDSEVGLMQVTPIVAREWAKETGLREFEQRAAENVEEFLKSPERNIQVGCWYLESLRQKYRDSPAEKSMMLAAYNGLNPAWVGGCRPIRLLDRLPAGGWKVRYHRVVTSYFVSSEILIAHHA